MIPDKAVTATTNLQGKKELQQVSIRQFEGRLTTRTLTRIIRKGNPYLVNKAGLQPVWKPAKQ
jgi:hypothetical protein